MQGARQRVHVSGSGSGNSVWKRRHVSFLNVDSSGPLRPSSMGAWESFVQHGVVTQKGRSLEDGTQVQLTSKAVVTKLVRKPALTPSPRQGTGNTNADPTCFQVPSDQGDTALKMMRLVTQQE